jgi:hypothetical protein
MKLRIIDCDLVYCEYGTREKLYRQPGQNTLLKLKLLKMGSIFLALLPGGLFLFEAGGGGRVAILDKIFN